MFIYYFFALIVIWLGILSLRNGLSFSGYVRHELALPISNFTPFVSVIAPCRGLEEGLRENINVFFFKQKTAYEIIFVTDQADDPALRLIEEVQHVRQDAWYPMTRCVVASPATDSG